MKYAFLVAMLGGGLSLFIYGMSLMTEGLQTAGGEGLKRMLARAGRNPILGIILGTVLGTLVQSSATTVMLVGFVNAGLLSLAQTVPAVLGANVGSSLSMQAVSLHIGDYCFFAISIGFITSMAARTEKWRQVGRAFMGFGLLFLGMNIMSDAIRPYRASLQPLLAHVRTDSLGGIVLATLVSTGLTAIWQSSGATIGMCFALADAGVFNDAEQVYPLLVGAHIGTCITALLGSIGTNIDARRTALTHLVYNLIAGVMALLAMPLVLAIGRHSAQGLIHQIANINTIMVLGSALTMLPFWRGLAALVCNLSPSREKPPQPSFLATDLLDTPERAIMASIDELRRAMDICRFNYDMVAEVILLGAPPAELRRIKLNEKVINEIKAHLKSYFDQLAKRELSRRQLMLMQEVLRCMSDIERIGDHIDKLSDISMRRGREDFARFDEDTLNTIFVLYRKVGHILQLTRESLYPALNREHDYRRAVTELLEARDDYRSASQQAKALLGDEVSDHRISQIAALFYREYIATFDRIVRHTASIAISRQAPHFRIKDRKLDKSAPPAPDFKVPPPVDIEEYLHRQLEDR